MALPVDTTRFVCRDDGFDGNGGGWIEGGSGTDYSNQAAAQYSLSGLTTAGASAVILTASASADMEGNLIQILSGTNFTPGFYAIQSVVVGTSITVDRNATTGVGAAGMGAIGGSLLTLQTALAALPASCQVYAKGSFSNTSAIVLPSLVNDNTFAARVTGFTAAIGDGGRFTLTTATNSINLVDGNAANGWIFSNMRWTSSAGTPGDGFHPVSGGSNCHGVSFVNCRLDHLNVGINGNFQVDWGIISLVLQNCEIDHCVSNGYQNSFGSKEIACYLHENGGHGFSYSGGASASGGTVGAYDAVDSTHWKNTGNAVDNARNAGLSGTSSAMMSLQSCNLVDNAIGVHITGGGGTNSEQALTLVNCIIYGNATGIDTHTATMVVAVNLNNFYGNNGTDRNGWPVGTGDVSLSADPFNGRTSGDFTLNNTAGGGAAVRGAGYPGVTSFGTGHADGGALQTASGGGGGGLLVHPGMQGGARG